MSFAGTDEILSTRIEAVKRLRRILEQNPFITEILVRADRLDAPNWYLAAGCISQTVWNDSHEFPSTANIKDYDLVYFDESDLSYERENFMIEKSLEIFSGIPVEIEVRNEARVHLWYKDHFGYTIEPYRSVENAIASFPCTATSIGAKYDEKGEFLVYSPFGFEDLFSLIIRPNKRQVTEEIYMEKVNRWKKLWPRLKVIPWQEGKSNDGLARKTFWI